MDAYVISLPHSDRKKICKKRLIKYGYKPIFVDALDANKENESHLRKKFDYVKFFSNYNVYPSVGEVGCAISHFKLYLDLAKLKVENNYFLITEDDCIPRAYSEELISIIEAISDQAPDIVLIGYSKVNEEIYSEVLRANPIKKVKNAFHGKYKIGRKYTETTCGTVSYLISSNFVKKLSDVEMPCIIADDWTYYKKVMCAKIFHVSPLCFFEDFVSMGSTIESSRSIKSTRKYKMLKLPKYARPIWQHILGLSRRILMAFSN